jgi:predicted nuclease of restriction endonuclease-like (RecB) superfamily
MHSAGCDLGGKGMSKKNAIVKQAVSQLPDTSIRKYADVLEAVKERISSARLEASIAVNTRLITLYWQIGNDIISRIEADDWGSQVIGRLSGDLRKAFPDMKGLSERNLRYMRQFAEAYPSDSIWQQPVAKLPWGHNLVLMQRIPDEEERRFYAWEMKLFTFMTALIHQYV